MANNVSLDNVLLEIETRAKFTPEANGAMVYQLPNHESCTDVMPEDNGYIITRAHLPDIEKDLGGESTVQLLFLLTPLLEPDVILNHCIAKLKDPQYFSVLEQVVNIPACRTGWRMLILEGLAITRRLDVLHCLRCNEESIKTLQKPQFISPATVSLHEICRKLRRAPTVQLISYMDVGRRARPEEFPPGPLLGDMLELHMLSWLRDSVISLEDTSRLQAELRRIGRDDLATDLKNACATAAKQHQPAEDAGHPGQNAYRNTHGLCIVLNQESFKCNNLHCHRREERDHGARHGSTNDAARLARLFQMFGCQVTVFHDSSATFVDTSLHEIAGAQDLDQFGYLVLCFLSHGDTVHSERTGRDEHHIFASDCRPVSVDQMAALFGADNCAALSGKLKIVITQACQGAGYLLPLGAVQSDGPGGSVDNRYQLSAQSDFLWLQASTPGYMAYRRANTGSMYIRNLCHVLEIDGEHQDIVQCVEYAHFRTLQEELCIKVGEGAEERQVDVAAQPQYKSTKMGAFKFRKSARSDQKKIWCAPYSEGFWLAFCRLL